MNKVWFLLAGVAMVAMSGAEPARSETLDEVLASTYATNPTLSARRARLRSADEGVPQALANWRPSVSLTGSAGRGTYYSNAVPNRYEATRSPRYATLSVTQPLYRGGRTVAATSQAENTVLAERALLAATEQSVLLSTINAYLNVVRDEDVVNLSINNEQVLRRQLDATQERFRVGEITRTDVSQADARLARAVADRIGAEGTLQTSRANYLNNVGSLPVRLVQPTPPDGLPGGADEVTSLALSANPNVLAADYTQAAARDGVDLVFGELLPTVTVSADMNRTLDTGTLSAAQKSATSTKEVLLNLSVPLYEGGGTYSRVRAAKHTAGQRRIEADQARRDATEAASKAWEGLQSARALMQSYDSQIRATELALAGVREESKVGSRTVLDVLNAEQEVFDARVNLVRAQHDMLLAAYQVRSAVGRLTAESLGLAVELYDPVRHYDDVRGKWIGNGIGQEKGYE
jgi:outer membrane protein